MNSSLASVHPWRCLVLRASGFLCRHCLWILGDAATLLGSGSVWGELVRDAVDRRCFYDWDDGGAGLLGVARRGHEDELDDAVEFATAFDTFADEAGCRDDICDALGSLKLA